MALIQEISVHHASRPRRTIRRKLGQLVVASVGTAGVLTGGLHAWHVADTYLRSKRETLTATAQVFSAATSSAVAARDIGAIRQSLRAVARVPGLMRAEVTDPSGRELAQLGGAVRLSGDLDIGGEDTTLAFRLLTSQTVAITVPVIDGGEEVGRLTLVSDASDILARFRSLLLWAGTATLFALGIGLLLALRLQRSIVEPITSLAAAMARVEATNHYVPVSALKSDDETGLLAMRFNSMIKEVRRSTDAILAREEEIIGRLSKAGEQRDDQTGQHVVRVARVSRIIASELGLEPGYITDLCKASPMHDVGKISIPDAILFKPGPLTPEERRKMEEHAEAGHEVLAGSSSSLVQLAAEIAISHHERWDGAGYPNRIAGEAIPLSGRITAVADVCDALLSSRPYKEPWSLEAVRQHLQDEAGYHFDPACVAAILARWEEIATVYNGTKSETVPSLAA